MWMEWLRVKRNKNEQEIRWHSLIDVIRAITRPSMVSIGENGSTLHTVYGKGKSRQKYGKWEKQLTGMLVFVSC